ncbi:LysM peptidoglycan-binding domain-containing protein, partial [Haemophilus influenzae]
QLKRKTLWLNESIKIPDNVEIKNKSLTIKENDFHKKQNSSVNNINKNLKKEKNTQTNNQKNIIPLYHKVTKNQTLYAISREYNIPVNILLSLNPHLKNGKVITGQKIRLREK